MQKSHFEISQEDIQEMFGPAVAKRGADYEQQGRVQIDTVEETATALTVRARVKGNYRVPYKTNLLLKQNRLELWTESFCSCPVAENCKHCVAAAFAFLRSRNQLSNHDLLKAEKWLHDLKKTKPKPPELAEDLKWQVKYLLSGKRPSLQVQIVRVQKLKRGGYGQRATPLDLSSFRYAYEPIPLPTEDLEIVMLLLGLYNQANRFYNTADATDPVDLKGDLGWLSLEKILATGQAHWQSHESAPLQWAEMRSLNMSWQKQAGGQKLSLQADGQDYPIFLEPRLLYLDPETAQLGPLDSDCERSQLTLLLKAPLIPSSHLAKITKELLKDLPQMPVPAGIEAAFQDLPLTQPIPHLQLREAKTSQISPEPAYLATLEFNYAGHLLGLPLEAVGMVQSGTKQWRIQRQRQAENAAMEKLQSWNLERLSADKSRKYLAWQMPGESLLEKIGSWDDFLKRGIPELKAAGWEIGRSKNFLRIDDSSHWQGKLAENKDKNWFDFSLDFEVEGKKANLLPLLVHLLKAHPNPEHLLISLSEQESVLLSLSPEHWVRVPAARILSIIKPLIELYDREPLNDSGHLELSLAQTLALEDLLNDPDMQWQGETRLRELLAKLEEFKGIEAISVPDRLQTELRPYQREGLNWLHFLHEYGFGGILADDMGLGKTVQTLAYLLHLQAKQQLQNPVLVIAPTSLLFNWQREAQRFAPDLKVLLLHGPQRLAEFKQIAQHDLVITTYALARVDQTKHRKQKYTAIILDEAQNIKNAQTKTAQAIYTLKAPFRLCLTGTPLENHLGELWSIYHFLMPGFLGPMERFNRYFRIPIEKLANAERRNQLRQRIEPFLLRRTKQAVLADLPEKTEIVSYIELEGPQRDLYESVRLAMDTRIRDEINQKGLKRSQIMILDALLKLRQTCCDPRLLSLEEAKKVHQSAKLEALLEFLESLLEEGRRVIVFSQFVGMLKLIADALDAASIDYALLTGQTRKREEQVDRFQNGEVPIFLISLKAGGVGLNLTAADTVIHYDPWWNPAVENQATDRAWRIGQEKKVFVYKLIAQNTVEEKILALQEQKRDLVNGIYSEQAEGGHAIKPEELLALLEINQ
jgi:SNF2 family DNA or RNA helicase